MCRHVSQLALTLTVALAVGGCTHQTRVQPADHFGGSAAWRLSNGEVEAVVSPATGRVVRYGFAGGPNALWENPDAAAEAKGFGGWKNWGGSKIWPSPQDHWKDWTGHDWPPPEAWDGRPYTCRRVAGGVELTSEPMGARGLRAVRTISLQPRGAELDVTDRVVGPDGRGTGEPVWMVTQVPVPEYVDAHLVDANDAAPVRPVEGFSPWDFERVSPGVIRAHRPPTLSAKIALNADAFAAVYRGQVLSIRADRLPPPARAAPVKADLYSLPDHASALPPGTPVYIELEFTTRTQLTTHWTLQKRSPPENP